MRTITAPGIEIREIDKSGYSPAMTGSACYIMGFSDKGEPYKPMEFTSRAAWTNYYGEPDNEAERYFYAAVCEVLNQNGRLYCARLPYDNDSFEKMVKFEYEVTPQDRKFLSADDSAYRQIYEQDREIVNYASITAKSCPTSCDLNKIDEYRTDESKVPANTFMIVDTTGSTYKKITEDFRKGKSREVIGIMPIVTTAANAMLAQSLIEVKNYEVQNYESISSSTLMTLDNGNAGLSQVVDTVKRFNTRDLFYLQKCKFDSIPLVLSGDDSSSSTSREPADLGDSVASVFDGMKAFAQSKGWSYDFRTFEDLRSFYNELKLSKWQSSEVSDTVDELKRKCEILIDYYTGTGAQWYAMLGDNELCSLRDDLKMHLPDLSDAYESLTASAKPLFTAEVSYVNPKTIVLTPGEEYEAHATMVSATMLDQTEWAYHGADGDDSVPNTMCLDANGFFSTIQPAADGEGFDPEHLKDIGVVVYKAWLDPAEGNKVSFEPVEAFCGSLFKDDKDPNTGVTKFIDTIINTQSDYINFFSNCFSKPSDKKWYLDTCDILIAEPSTGASLGFFEDMTREDISISKSIFDGMNKALDKVSDINERDIDIVCDAGLANIASYLKAIYGDKGQYDLTVTDDLGNSLLSMWKAADPTNAAVKIWKTVEYKLDNFCKNVRKDCMFIADGLRPLVLQGQKKVIRDSKPTNTIDANILPYLKTITGLNTSYCGLYMDWFEQADDYTGDFFWCPPSIKAMGVYVNTDVNFNYWDAPAGLNRGVIAATDVAFSPTIKQAGAIYEKCINYAVNYPNDGIVLEGQRTTQVKPSAFDRVNVRRLFCRLERMAYKISRYFLYEGNTAYVRQRLVDALDPYFKECKIGGGIYDYKIICDESNNTPTTIDRNELHVSIGIKPVKTIEFIMIDFVATSTGASWQEVGM